MTTKGIDRPRYRDEIPKISQMIYLSVAIGCDMQIRGSWLEGEM